MSKNNVLILKQLTDGFSIPNKTLSGIVRVETDFGVTEISLSLVNVSAINGGEFFLYIFGANKDALCFTLSSRPSNFHKSLDSCEGLSNGFASALVAIKNDIPVTVAFGATGGFNLSLSNAKKYIAEKCLTERKKRKVEIAEPATPPPLELDPEPTSVLSNFEQAELPPEQPPITKYDDEAVATINYFELDKNIKEKLDKISEIDNESISNADGNPINQCQEEEKEKPNGTDFLSDEKNTFTCEKQDDKPFFITAERELNTLFNKFPRYDNLLGFFPDSKWVKINYDKENFYIVGVIREDKKEKYICYGVPAKYSPEPPKELKGYCSFIPLSIFDMQGEGFWMMFQDALTGDCITPKK